MHRREISTEHPLFNFKDVDWTCVPEALRPYSSVMIQGAHPDYEAKLKKYCDQNIYCLLQTEYWNSFQHDWVIAPAELERLLDTYQNIIAVSVVEMSCFDLNDIQLERLLTIADICSRHGIYFLWEDMGYPDRKHVFAVAGDDPRFQEWLLAHSDTIIFQDKINGWGQYHLTRSMAMGYWLTGMSPAWGVNVEDFWWYEQGYAQLYAPSRSRTDYNIFKARFGQKMAEMLLQMSEYACPEALMGQILAAALMQGACVVSFEVASRMIAYRDQLTPLFKRVLMPLHLMAVNDGLISSKAQVTEKIKAAYVADDWESDLFAIPCEQPFLDLYCPARALEKIAKDNSSGSVLQQTGRYFVVPVVPEFLRDRAEKVFPELLDSQTVPDDKKRWFDQRYTETFGDGAYICRVGKCWLISHTEENADITRSFRDLPLCGGRFTVSGRLQPHSFILAFEKEDGLRLHLSNFRSDAVKGVFNNDRFAHYCEDYISNDCTFLGDDRETVLTVNGASSFRAEGGTVTVTTEGDARRLTVLHNGPVEIFLCQ